MCKVTKKIFHLGGEGYKINPFVNLRHGNICK